MYISFRLKPINLGYLDVLDLLKLLPMHAFIKKETSGEDNMDERMDERLDVIEEDIKTGIGRKMIFNRVNEFLIQVSITCLTRRRSRGEAGVISNKMNHIVNGNRGHYLDCLFQNLPGKQSKQKDKQIAIETILDQHRPILLGIAEPQTEDLEKMRIGGYNLVKGTLKRGRKIRLNVLSRMELTTKSSDSARTSLPL